MIFLVTYLELLTQRTWNLRNNLVSYVEDGNLGRLVRAHIYSLMKAKHKFNRHSTVYHRAGRATHHGSWYDLPTGSWPTVA